LKGPREELTDDDRGQGISYARLVDPIAPLVLVTNGADRRLYDTITGGQLSPRVAVFVPALIVAAMTAAKGHPSTEALAVVIVALVCWVTWHHGFLAGVMTIWLPDMLESAYSLLRAPGGEPMTAGVMTLVLACIPLAIVLMARRRVLAVPAPSGA
jgi:hypothetical protein